MMKKILIIMFLLCPYVVFAQLKINEIMTNNVSAVMDDAYNYSMWVELYNAGDVFQDQRAYYFTDDLSQPQKWQPF